MRGWLVIAVVSTGCRGILGIDDVQLAGDAPPVHDAAPDVVDGSLACYGRGLVKDICLDAPASPLQLTGTIDTTTACPLVRDGACLFVGSDVTVPTAGVRFVGARPVVVVATGTLRIDGALDVSSRRTGSGAGASPPQCAPAIAGQGDTGGGGGGGGGSFVGHGGDGGVGDLNQNGGLDGTGDAGTGAPTQPVDVFRGGCRGAPGGVGGGAAGTAGEGGGAVYLIAGSEIVVAGSVTANGAGGGGGANQAGGGGGGSGGFIGFDAPSTTNAGVVTANGGGGGEGGGLTADGANGTDGLASTTRALGGANIADGGDGGTGSGNGSPGGTNAGSSNSGGGGGGGGAGIIYAKTTINSTGVLSPEVTPF